MSLTSINFIQIKSQEDMFPNKTCSRLFVDNLWIMDSFHQLSKTTVGFTDELQVKVHPTCP